MSKYFIVSDIHSFATELKQSLREAGFNKRSKDHFLVVLGDIFDRGNETIEVYNFIKSIPKKRRVLVRGNHEQLLLDLLHKPYPDTYDYSNGTLKTFTHIVENLWGVGAACNIDWEEQKDIVRESEIVKWLQSDEWQDYFELDKYIFVHSFIPVHNLDDMPDYYVTDQVTSYFSDWRTNATRKEWLSATWGCPWVQYENGLFKEEAKNGKVLVVGHWHTSDFFENLSHKKAPVTHSIWYGHHLIGIDGGVFRRYDFTLYHPQNVLVTDSNDFNTCMDETGQILTYMDTEDLLN